MAIQKWMEAPENRDFVSKHSYLDKWQPVDGAATPSIIAFFKKDENAAADKPGGKRASPLRNGGTSINYMRSTNYTTGVPGGPMVPPGPPPAGS